MDGGNGTTSHANAVSKYLKVYNANSLLSLY